MNQSLGEVVKILMKDYGLVLGLEESIEDRSHNDYDFPFFTPRVLETNPTTVGNVTYSVSAERIYTAKGHLISLNFKDREMEVVIESIARQMGNYTWSYSDGVYNLIPSVGRDKRYLSLLELKIKNYSLKPTSTLGDIQRGLFALPEVKAFLLERQIRAPSTRTGVTIDDLRRPLGTTFEASNVSFRQILNRIAKTKGGGWILRKGSKRVGTHAEYIELDI